MKIKKMGVFSWFKHEYIYPDVRALSATIFVHSTQTVLLVRNIVSEDHKWVFLAYLITSPYVLRLERWMLPFSYIRRQTVLLVRDIVYEDCKYVI